MYKFKTFGIVRRNAANTPAALAQQESEIQSRRNVLRTIMAITGSLWLPIAVSTSSSANAAVETGQKKRHKQACVISPNRRQSKSVATATISLQPRIPANWWMARSVQRAGAACGARRTEVIAGMFPVVEPLAISASE